MTYKFDEEITAQVARNLVLVNDLFHLRVMLDVALEEVEWRVISVEESVLDVLFKRDFQLAAWIALANLEQGVSKAFPKALHQS